jgi:hypothetical protein
VSLAICVARRVPSPVQADTGGCCRFCFGEGTAKLAGDATVARRGDVMLQRAGCPAAGRSGWEGHGRARRPDDTNRHPPA